MSLSLRTLLASSVLALAGAVALPGMATAATFSVADSPMSFWARSETGSKKPRKAKDGKKSKGGGITFNDGSAESRSERDRRLTRECKGRSNSGVCEGYTR
jgi:hypothetical protein